MNGEPTTSPENHDRPPAPPTFARQGAASQIRSGFGERLNESLDSTGKALAILAGLGALFIAAGYLVEWQRFKHGGLPPEEVLPLLPKDQVAAAGVRELVISVLFILITLGLLGFVLVGVGRAAAKRKSRLARGVSAALSRDVGFPTAIVGAITLLIVPLDAGGIVVVAMLTGLLFYGLTLIRGYLEHGDDYRFPLWRLALAVGLAAFVLSVAREAEFPERRPDAIVLLVSGERIKGAYLASDSDKVLLRQLPDSSMAQCDLETTCEERCHRDRICIRECRFDHQRCGRPRLLVVPRSEVKKVQVTQWPELLSQERSLLDRIVDRWAPGFALRCIPPECRWDGETRIGPSSFL